MIVCLFEGVSVRLLRCQSKLVQDDDLKFVYMSNIPVHFPGAHRCTNHSINWSVVYSISQPHVHFNERVGAAKTVRNGTTEMIAG